MLNARASITLPAPADKVWAIVTDYAGYARFPGITAAQVRKTGSGHPAGVGAVREVTVGPSSFVEEIVEFEPSRRLAYRIIESRPVKIDHELGWMQLTPRGDQTDIEWVTRGKVALPLLGALLEGPVTFIVQRSFERILRWIKLDLERASR